MAAQGARIGARNEAIKAHNVANAQLSADIKKVLATLDKLPKELRGEVRKAILEKAAQPLIDAAKANAPQSDQEHFDYGKQGPNAQPTKYYPGNLKKSIRIIPYKKSFSVYVGPKVLKRGGKAKAYGRNERNVNAFYAGFVEFGTSRSAARPYMRPAFDQSKAQVLAIAAREMQKVVRQYEQKNKV